MSRKREVIFMGIGILAGLALSGPAAQASDYLTARSSTQTFYLDGEKIGLTAYLIGGSNYVRLRDIGKAVDFSVTYDATTNTVYIDPDAHYEQEVTILARAAAFPSATITEESIQAVLEQLKQTYPTGTVFPAPYRSTSNGPYSRGIHCSGWASLAKVTKAHVDKIGGYSFVQVDGYEEYTMPTPIHELSMAAATYTQPVNSFSTTAWQSATMAPAMAANEPAKALQRYCTSAGLTPLASEWWHFNDLVAYNQIQAHCSTGNYLTSNCLSMAPSTNREE